MPNHSYENEFDLHENEPVGGTYFHLNGFPQGLVLTWRQKATRKCLDPSRKPWLCAMGDTKKSLHFRLNQNVDSQR